MCLRNPHKEMKTPQKTVKARHLQVGPDRGKMTKQKVWVSYISG